MVAQIEKTDYETKTLEIAKELLAVAQPKKRSLFGQIKDLTETEAQSYLQSYLELMAQLAEAAKNWSRFPQIDEADGEPLSRVQVSVKLTAFYSQFD